MVAEPGLDVVREVRDLVLRVAHREHAGHRERSRPPAEPLERSVERTGQSQRTRILWLHEMVERWPEHAEEIMDATREIADRVVG